MIDTDAENWLRELLPQVIAVAREAGQAIMTIYGQIDPEVEFKADDSPLTQADLISQHLILNGLGQLSPNWPVLSEETGEIPFNQRKLWQYFWMVDPLDGTKEFLHRNGEFTVNIALIKGNTPILGVVYAPAMDRLYFAAAGTGAWKAAGNGPAQIRVAKARDGEATRVLVSRSHRTREENLDRFLGGAANYELIGMGSSLKFCLIAEGAADLYPRIGPTMEWDTAAAHCILGEAGGLVTDLDGNSMHYNKRVLRNSGFLARGASCVECG